MGRWTLARVEDAFAGFFGRVKRGAGKAGFPRFKSKGRWRSFGLHELSGLRLDTRPASGTRRGRVGTGAPGPRDDRVSTGDTHAGNAAPPLAARSDVELERRTVALRPVYLVSEPGELDASRAKENQSSATPNGAGRVASRGAEMEPVREGGGPTHEVAWTGPVAPASPSTREGRPQAIASAPSVHAPWLAPLAPKPARVTVLSYERREAWAEPPMSSVTKVAAIELDKPLAENVARDETELVGSNNRTAEDDKFRPDDIEIVGALRPPKKQFSRQRQRSRDYDRER